MQIYKKILVTIDCSPVDKTIVEHVAALALQNRATVYLLHVVHSHTLDQNRVLRENCEACLSSHQKALRSKGIETHIIIRSGEPELEILDEIDNEDYDLIAMATHGHGLLGDLLFGSVSDKLKHRIQVPLLLIKSDTG
jgi:universal stress protein A